MFPKDRKSRVLRILNLIGVFLIHLPSRPLLYLGNLAVYVPSYIILHTGELAIDNDGQRMSTNTTHHYNIDVSTNVSTRNISEELSQHYGIQESWFVPVFSTSWMLGTFLSGVLATYIIRARFVIGLGIIFQSGSLFVSYFTINVSEPAFFIMLCIFIGFGAGLYEGLLLKNYVVVRLNNRTGTVTSLVLSSGPLGGVIINQFITWYTNPENLSPDVKMGEMRIFSQDSIQERIPSMFLILGSTMFGLTALGFFLLGERKTMKNSRDGDGEVKNETEFSEGRNSCVAENEDSKTGDDNLVIICNKISSDKTSFLDESSPKGKPSLLSITNDSSNTHYEDQKAKSIVDDTAGGESGKINLLSSDNFHRNTDFREHNSMDEKELVKDNNEENDPDDTNNALYHDRNNESALRVSNNNLRSSIIITPLELLKSPAFYKVAIVYIFGSSARLFLSVYYKIYGQEWIHDDHFLTNLATIMSFLAVFTTVIWGLVLDKIGLKLCFIVIYTGISTLFLLMYFSAQLNKWAYFFVTLSNSSFVNYLYPIFTIAIIKWFGRDYLSAKLGVVEIFSTAGYVLATFVLAGLMDNYGFLSGFIWTSSVHLVGLIIIIVAFPKT